ncbi:MAG: hypothetical protein KAT12_09305, partial [Gammaproteobacteria bacterium]|nr:hypothetical protein [Gammaproteobacteria bacterium]
ILIDLSRQGFGEPELKLGDSSGFSTALVYQHELTTSSSIGITMRYHRWKFGRSNTETISNGVSTFNITEPRSVSQHSTISFDYRYRF